MKHSIIIVAAILCAWIGLNGCSDDTTCPDTTPISTTGSIIVDPAPDSLNCPWQLSGPSSYIYNGSGDEDLLELMPGNYTLTWDSVSGWITPDTTSQTQELVAGGIIIYAATYVQRYGTIAVDPEPDAINAPWQLTGPESYYYSGNGDEILTGLTPGDYTLTWGGMSGYDSPSPEIDTLTLAAGGYVLFSGTYISQAQTIILDFSSGTFQDIPPSNGTDYYEQDGFIVELENSSLGINSGSCPGRWCVQNPYTEPEEVTLLSRADGGSFDLVSVQVTQNSQGVTFSADGGAYQLYSGVGTATFSDVFEDVTIVRIGVPCSGQYVSCYATIDNIQVVYYPTH